MKQRTLYTKSGATIEIIGELNGALLGRRMMVMTPDDPDGSPYYELSPCIEVFGHNELLSKPPVEFIRQNIENLKAKCRSLHETIRTKKRTIEGIEQKEKELFSRLARFKALERIDKILSGDFQWCLLYGDYLPRLMPLEEALAVPESDRWSSRNKLRMLTLYGDTKGDMTFGLERFSDGSGEYGASKIELFETREAAADALMKEVWDIGLREVRFRYWDRYDEIMKKNGMEYPPAIAKLRAEDRMKVIGEAIQKADLESLRLATELEELRKWSSQE